MATVPISGVKVMGDDTDVSSFQLVTGRDDAMEKGLLVGSVRPQGAAANTPRPQLKGMVTVAQKRWRC